MIRHLDWFDRTFSFDFPLALFPNIVERLRGTPARLVDRLVGLPRAVLTRREGQRWSVQEHAGHLLDLGSLELARLDDYAAGKDQLTPADLGNRKTIEALHNERNIRDLLAEFRRERGELVRRLESLDDSFISRTAVHPRLGTSMRVVDFAFFIAEHDDHHLTVIAELLRVERS
jgi:hypothetical protein